MYLHEILSTFIFLRVHMDFTGPNWMAVETHLFLGIGNSRITCLLILKVASSKYQLKGPNMQHNGQISQNIQN